MRRHHTQAVLAVARYTAAEYVGSRLHERMLARRRAEAHVGTLLDTEPPEVVRDLLEVGERVGEVLWSWRAAR